MNIATTLKVGDTWSWEESLDDYPADVWTLKFAMRGNANAVNITASASGLTHAISVAAADTAKYVAGKYHWEAYVEMGSGPTLERYAVGSGKIELLPALFQTPSGVDVRSHAEKVLDAVEAVIEGRATQAQASMSIMGRAIQFIPISELLMLRTKYRAEVKVERGESSLVRAQFGRA